MNDLKFEFPVRYDDGTQWVWTADDQHLLDMRGWGWLTGTGGMHLPEEEAMALQDARGDFVAKCINEHESLTEALRELREECEMYKSMAEGFQHVIDTKTETEFSDSVKRSTNLLMNKVMELTKKYKTALEHVRDMPEYDQDDAFRLRMIAENALKPEALNGK